MFGLGLNSTRVAGDVCWSGVDIGASVMRGWS